MIESDDEFFVPGPDYEVTCARCGHTLMASKATPEEGDEWECLPCNDMHNRLEKAARTHELDLAAVANRDARIAEQNETIRQLTEAVSMWMERAGRGAP